MSRLFIVGVMSVFLPTVVLAVEGSDFRMTPLQIPEAREQVQTRGWVDHWERVDAGLGLRAHVRLLGQSGGEEGSVAEFEFPIPSEVLQSIGDWESKVEVLAEVRASEALRTFEDQSYRARLFVVDTEGRRIFLPNAYFSRQRPENEGWVGLFGTVTTQIPIPLGHTDAGFDSAHVVKVGINFEGGFRRKSIVQGDVEVRNLRLKVHSGVTMPRVLPVDPVVQEGELERASRMERRLAARLGDRAQEKFFGVNLAWPVVRTASGIMAPLYSTYLHTRYENEGERLDIHHPRVQQSLRTDFERIRALFGEHALVRMFTLVDGYNYIDFDEAGFPLPFRQEVINGFRILFDIAVEERVLVMPVLFDFLIATDFGLYPGEDQRTPFEEMLLDPAKRHRLMEHIQDLVSQFANHPAVLVWDLINEPENATRLVTPEHFDAFQSFLREGVDAIHRAGELATIGHRNPLDAALYARGRIPVDLGQAHRYPYLETRVAPFGLNYSVGESFGDIPSGWGEIPARGGEIQHDYEAAFSGGSRYVLFWDWRGDDSSGDGFEVQSHGVEIEEALSFFRHNQAPCGESN